MRLEIVIEKRLIIMGFAGKIAHYWISYPMQVYYPELLPSIPYKFQSYLISPISPLTKNNFKKRTKHFSP